MGFFLFFWLVEEDIRFPTKAQQIDRLRFRDGPNAAFVKLVERYWMNEYGVEFNVPVCNGVEVDLYLVKKVIDKRGGGFKVFLYMGFC